jgi:hypothetical protein
MEEVGHLRELDEEAEGDDDEGDALGEGGVLQEKSLGSIA